MEFKGKEAPCAQYDLRKTPLYGPLLLPLQTEESSEHLLFKDQAAQELPETMP